MKSGIVKLPWAKVIDNYPEQLKTNYVDQVYRTHNRFPRKKPLGNCQQSQKLWRWPCCWLVKIILTNFILKLIAVDFSVRSKYERYEEKSYQRILKVEAVATPPPGVEVNKEIFTMCGTD